MSNDDRSEFERLRAESMAELDEADPVVQTIGVLPPRRPMSSPQPPPTPVGRQGPQRLERDPDGPIAGVASGLAHYLGVDPVWVRLAVAALALTTPFGFIGYLAAWVIMPKAQVSWPSYQRTSVDGQRRRNGTSVLLIVAVVLVNLWIDGIGTKMVAACLLIACGIWLLTQRSPKSETVKVAHSPTYPDQVGSAYPGNQFGAAPAEPLRAYAGSPYLASDPYAGFAAPPRARRWGRLLLILFLVGFGLVMLFGLGTAAFFTTALSNGGWSAGERTYHPSDPGAIPSSIQLGAGEVDLDFSLLDSADLSVDSPHTIEVDLGAGQVLITAPDDIPVYIESDVGFGESQLDLPSVGPEDAMILIDVDIGAGELVTKSASLD